MAMIKSHRYSIADFLTLPEVYPPLEFFGGRVIQKMSPKLPHSIIQGDLGYELNIYARSTGAGWPYPEPRCTFGGGSHVFDLAFFVADRLPDPTSSLDRANVGTPPDLAVEILSPGQTVGELARKLRSAIRRGVRFGWLIDETRRHVHIYQPTGKPRVIGPGDVLSGKDVLPGFALPVDQLFQRVKGS